MVPEARAVLLRAVAHPSKGIDPVAILGAVAANPKYALANRAFALRSLAGFPDSEAERILLKGAGSKEPDLLSAAADAAWVRHRHDAKAPELNRKLVAVATEEPERASRAPGVARFLAATGEDKALQAVLEACTTTALRDPYFAAAGPELNGKLLASLLDQIDAKPTDAARATLRGLVSQSPRVIEQLYRVGRFDTLVDVVAMVPGTLRYPSVREALARILNGQATPQARTYAVATYRRHTLRAFPGHIVFEPGDMRPWPLPRPDEPRREQRGFSSGLRLGDAAYRLLDNLGVLPGGVPTFGEHWHAGLFGGFKASVVDSHAFFVEGIQVDFFSNPLSEVIRFPTATTTLLRRDADLVDEMETLRDGFVRGLEGTTEPGTYRGARSVPGLSYTARSQIVDTAQALADLPITYTLYNMLEWWGHPFGSFDGSPDDVRALRCCGLVEYAYEANGIRVMSGEVPAQWSIAQSPGTHNDFHGRFLGNRCEEDNYHQGETCPRSQAGNVGSDTTFEELPETMPEILDLEAATVCNTVRLRFRIEAEASRFAFVRVLVNRRGDAERYFADSVDPFGLGTVPVGTWALRREDLLASGGDLQLMWGGQTTEVPERLIQFFGSSQTSAAVPGPDFGGSDGTYVFTLQCIDEGGNVSHGWSIEHAIDWN